MMETQSAVEIWVSSAPQLIIVAIVFLVVHHLNKKFLKFMDLHMRVSSESLESQKQVAQTLKEIKELLEKK